MSFFHEFFVEILLVKAIAISIVISALFSTIFSLPFSAIGDQKEYIKRLRINILACLSYGTPIILIGYTTGMLAGLSRTGVMGNLLPAVLSALGGVLVYVFGADVKHARIISYCVCAFVLSTFYGVEKGAHTRANEQEVRLQKLMVIEKRLRHKRDLMDLPENFPEWLVRSEPK